MADSRPTNDFSGKTVLVTGGASGIGRAAATLFAARGASVMIADLDQAHGEDAAASIRAAGGAVRFRRTDVTSEEDVAGLIADTLTTYGGLHCAFNNAGVNGPFTVFHEMSLPEWNRVIAADLTSVFLCMKHELAHMSKSGGGAIVNTASGAGFSPAPGLPHYTAAKHGVLGLTKAAAKEYAAAGIRVNAICPGVTNTAMMQSFIAGNKEIEQMMLATLPFGRMGRPEEVAEAAVWLCSDAASFVSGESMLVDGASVCR